MQELILGKLTKASYDHTFFSSRPQRPPHLELEIRRQAYTVKVASTASERRQAYRLRHEVFYGEVQDKPSRDDQLDIDPYDQQADLLILLEGQRVIGTYRILFSDFADQFYSSSEFNLDFFLEGRGPLMEVSRACIAKTKRNGVTLTLLWQGLMKYAEGVQANTLFGCSSIWSPCPKVAVAVKKHYQERGKVVSESRVMPRPGYRVALPASEEDIRVEDYLSPLLRTYLKAGAMLHGDPAFDAEFMCFDFLTALDVEALGLRFRSRFC